jgi:hypothetical protein
LDAARMKTVEVTRDYAYRLDKRRLVQFKAGITYRRVLETAAREIERAGAGRIVGSNTDPAGSSVDARDAFRL